MSKVYLLWENNGEIQLDRYIKGITTNKKVAEKFHQINTFTEDGITIHINQYEEFELNDPELLNRIAKESNKIETEELYDELKDINKSEPYKGAIKIPCSACGEDKNMDYHNHNHVPEKDRRSD